MIKGGGHWYALLFVFSFFLHSFILSFFSIVTFLGWTRLHATWIKPEVVATKKYTGYSVTLPVHHDWILVFMESVLFIYVFFWVLVCPCQLFVRLWYRVSDVLDLSLVSKRFGFWPHITHVIVLTFKEIKHLSDYRIIGRTSNNTYWNEMGCSWLNTETNKRKTSINNKNTHQIRR